MHTTDSAALSPRSYSPFWPLLILMIAFLIGMSWELRELRQQTRQVRDQVQRLEPSASQAQNINRGINLFMADLRGLAATDAEAKAIIERHFASIAR